MGGRRCKLDPSLKAPCFQTSIGEKDATVLSTLKKPLIQFVLESLACDNTTSGRDDPRQLHVPPRDGAILPDHGTVDQGGKVDPRINPISGDGGDMLNSRNDGLEKRVL